MSKRNKDIIRKLFTFFFFAVIWINLSYTISSVEQKQIPDTSIFDVPEYRILINDKSVDRNVDIHSLIVVNELSLPSFAEVTILFDRNHPLNGESYFHGINKKVEIQIGYRSNMQTVFTGHIIAQEISNTMDSPYKLIVYCRDDQISSPSNPIASPVLNLQYGSNVINFDISMNKNKEIEGFISISGIHEPLLGNNVQLESFSSGFNKLLKVIRVEHILDKNGWFTTLNIMHN